VLALGAIAFYVGVYTMGLKRRTPQNIVWGGAAGCMPVLIGWSAVTGSLSWAPVVLFAVIFFWTPPHYWPLSLRFRADYAAAGVPMLPVVAGPVTVARQVVAYSWVMVAVSLLLWPVAGTTPVYPVAAAVLGAAFLREAHALLRRARSGAAVEPVAMRVFHGSITYLTLLFLAVAVDPLLPL
jgi:protoheme IX farnesyltransferase